MRNKNKLKSKLSSYISPFIEEAIEFDKSYFKISVKECGEELVDVEKIIKEKNLNAVFNSVFTATGQKRLFLLRKSLVPKLMSAMKDLEEYKMIMRFEYLYRRLDDQKASFERSVRTFMQKYPKLDKKSILEIAGVFVAATPATAGHLSGASMDITLVDADLKPVDMGVPYIHPGPESTTFYPNISEVAKKNRKILFDVMEKNSFSNYPYEYWHFSMGDRIDARIKGKKFAIYGPVVYNPQLNTTENVKNPEKAFDVSYLFNK